MTNQLPSASAASGGSISKRDGDGPFAPIPGLLPGDRGLGEMTAQGRHLLLSWTSGKGHAQSVTASVSPEICFGCSVVNQTAGPEANPLLRRPEQSLDPASSPGCQPGGVAEVGGETAGFGLKSPV